MQQLGCQSQRVDNIFKLGFQYVRNQEQRQSQKIKGTGLSGQELRAHQAGKYTVLQGLKNLKER